jgi:hypothetical protein
LEDADAAVTEVRTVTSAGSVCTNASETATDQGEGSNNSVTSPSSPVSVDPKLPAIIASGLGDLSSLFLEDIYFVTKDGQIEGMSSTQSDLAIANFVKKEHIDAELSDASAVESVREKLLQRSRSKMSTTELLYLYNKFNIKNQICLVGKFA